MKKNDLLIIGAGGHAVSCIDVIEAEGRYTIAGIIDIKEKVGQSILGYKIVGSDFDLHEFVSVYKNALVSIGQIKTADIRKKIYEKAVRLGFNFPAIVSPSAYVSPRAVIGKGTIVMHGAVINADVVIGDNCIINSMALIEHGVKVFSHSHIATGSRLNGDVVVGCESFVGSGAVIHQGVFIGAREVIASGAIIKSKNEIL